MNPMSILRNFSRLLAAFVFLFSGIVKAVDPLGTAYKFGDYLIALNLSFLLDYALFFAFLMIAAEFVIGWLLLFNVKTRINAWFVLAFMLLFTPVTLWLAVTNAVDDCGCFGDFLKMTNWETFYKNVVILLFVLILFFTRKSFKNNAHALRQFLLGTTGVLLVTLIMADAYRNLPRFDFRPFHKGANIANDMLPVPEIAEVLLVYKNSETGQEMKFLTQDLPYQDTVLWPLIKDNFLRQEKGEVFQEFQEAKTDFPIMGPDGSDAAAQVIREEDFTFLIIIYDLDKVTPKKYHKLIALYQQALNRNIPVKAITGASYEDANAFLEEMETPMPHYSSDITKLKTVVRSNPGLLLIRNGYVIDKWHHRNVPDLDEYELTAPLDAFISKKD
jgi:uncharacterized membrane protein YphA (DoxX/SURF4 family)